MIWLLRNIAVRFWLTALLSLPLGFYLMPVLTQVLPEVNVLWLMLAIIAGTLLIIGFIMDSLAKNILMGLIKQGQVWEMSGIHTKAETKYHKALRLYDTFLPGIISSKKMARKILSAIARFKLNTASANENFSLAAAMYVRMNPSDRDMTDRWLRQVKQARAMSPLDHEVLSFLSETGHLTKPLSELKTGISQTSEKPSATEKQVYHPIQKTVFPKLADRPEKVAIKSAKPAETLGAQKPYHILEPKSVKKEKPQRVNQSRDYFKAVTGVAGRVLRIIGRVFKSVLDVMSGVSSYVYKTLKDSEQAKFYLKTGFLAALSIFLTVFIINTVLHIIKSKPEPVAEKTEEKAEVPVDKPFTIQVSAYLKKEFADSYVNNLKKRDIQATVKKVDGGGKTWFVVRVSEFEDKKSADAYGQQLKKQKIIDDFFVTNK